jgi:beta-galactosidase
LDLPQWQFRLRRRPWFWRRGFPDRRAEEVPLPHSWNAHDTFLVGRRYYRGPGYYRLAVDLPADGPPGQRWFLRTEGFYGTGALFVDGRRVTRFDAAFLGLEVDLTERLRPGGRHWLAFDLTNDCPNHVLPGIREPDFVLHGGLAGEVWLERRPPAHFVREGAWAWLAADDESVGVAAEITNAGDREARVEWDCVLRDAEGRELARQSQEARVAAGRTLPVTAAFRLPSPRLWSCEDPYLHQVRLELRGEPGDVDALAFSTGFRRAEFRANQGFFLNGRRLVLRGINRHENMPGFGNALPPAVHETDAALLRDMGLNLVRLSHYPQHPRFLEACDRLGILVYAELASWKSVRTGRWLRNAKDQLRRLVRRDRHHPSVILWGLGNEGRHARAYRELDAVAKEHDPTRVTIYAENHLYRARRRRTTASTDVYGLNYELEAYNEARRLSARQVVLVSELCNQPDTTPGDAAAEFTQAQALLAAHEAVRGKPGLAGFCYWCLADYATLRKKRYLRYSGVVDAWRKPKLGAALLRALFSGAPVLEARVAPPGPGGERVVHGVSTVSPVVAEAGGKVLARAQAGPLWSLTLPAGARGVALRAGDLQRELPDGAP